LDGFMRLTTVFYVLLLLLGATRFVVAQEAGEPTPPDVRGFHTSSGIRLSSENPANAFTLDINGKSIQPVSTKRLLWRVDDKEIELSIARRPWILPDSASDPDTLHAYLDDLTPKQGPNSSLDDSPRNKAQRSPKQHSPFVDSFECETGRTCALWVVVEKGKTTWTGAAVNGNNIILLSAAAVSQSSGEALQAFLKTTLLTLRRGKIVAAKSTEPPSNEGGASLRTQINFREALLGEAHVAFINRSLMTANDAAVSKAIPISPSAMIEVAKFMVCAEARGMPLTVSVFDGSLSHAINLQDWNSAAGMFKYWDPWGQSSFLAQGNNHADIAATPHPSEKRMWLVKASDLQRVVYSMILMESEAISVIRLATLLAGPDLAMVDTYRTLKLENSDAPEVADTRFASIASYLVENKQLDTAIRIDNLRLSIYPERASDLTQSLGSTLQAAGRPDLVSRIAALGVADSPPSPLMRDIASAQKEDFFEFFHLAKTAEEPTVGRGRLVKFRPSGPKFHDIVEITVEEQPSGKISAWSVLIAQSMIDDPTNRIFASDIAKSFLQFIVPSAGNDAVGRMAGEIWSNQAGKRSEVPLPGAPAGVTVPSIPSLAYLTFVGAHEKYIVPLRGAKLRLAHVRQSDGDWLQISVFTPSQN